MTQLVKNPSAMRETWVRSLCWEDSPGEEKGYPLQYSGLENSMDCIVYGVAKSRTRQRDFHFQASLIAQLVNNLPAMQETPVLFLAQEDPLEKR